MRGSIEIKSAEDIERMRVAGRLAAEVLRMIRPHVRPGVTTGHLYRGIVPFVIIQLIFLLVVILFPEVVYVFL